VILKSSASIAYHDIAMCPAIERIGRVFFFRKDKIVCTHQYVVNIDERVLREFEENPSFNIRRVARIFGITRDMVHRILKQNGLHPFHYQRVQQLLPRDEESRINFCKGIFIFHSFLFITKQSIVKFYTKYNSFTVYRTTDVRPN